MSKRCQPRAPVVFNPQNIFLVLISVKGWVEGHCVAGRIMSMKNPNDTIGDRTRDLPACGTVPQPSAPPRALYHEQKCWTYEIFHTDSRSRHVNLAPKNVAHKTGTPLQIVSHVFEHPTMWEDEGVEVKLQSLFKLGTTHPWMDSYMNPPPPAPGKAPLVPGWAPNLFYTLRKIEKTLPVSGIEIRIPRSSSACSSHYTIKMVRINKTSNIPQRTNPIDEIYK